MSVIMSSFRNLVAWLVLPLVAVFADIASAQQVAACGCHPGAL